MTDFTSAGSISLYRIRGDIVASINDDVGQITVIENNTYRILTFDRVCEQSKMQKSSPDLPVHNYIRAMLMVTGMQHPARALILGLGGGCLARAIAARYPECHLDIVELRAAVIDVARQHFCLPDTATLRCHAADAAEFVASSRQPEYDIIFSDLYDADSMSPLQEQADFLADCAQRLTRDGWLVLNLPRKPSADSPIIQILQRHFGTLLRCVVPSGNAIIYAGKSICDISLADLRHHAAKAGSEFGANCLNLAKKLSLLNER